WALANGDRPHTLQMAFVYQLPWRSATGQSSIAKALINDWQVNGIFGAFSGSPFTVTADGTILNTPGNTQTADLVGDVKKIGAIRARRGEGRSGGGCVTGSEGRRVQRKIRGETWGAGGQGAHRELSVGAASRRPPNAQRIRS